MNTKHYKGKKADVDNYLAALNGHEKFPIVLENGYRMDEWSRGARECEDGDWTVEQPPEWLLVHHGIDIQEIGLFRAAMVSGKLELLDNRPALKQVVVE